MKQKNASKLLKTWLIILFGLGIPVTIYTHYLAYINGLSKPVAPLWLEILLGTLILFVGLPLLGRAVQCAKIEKNKRVGRIAGFLFVHHALCLVGELIGRIF